MAVDDTNAVVRIPRWVALAAALLSAGGVAANAHADVGPTGPLPTTTPPVVMDRSSTSADVTPRLELPTFSSNEHADSSTLAPFPLASDIAADDAPGTASDVERPILADDEEDQSGGSGDRLHISFKGEYIWSPVAGYVQTPRGGARHTASHHRPRLSELGIDSAAIPDLELGVSYGPHQFFAGAQLIRMSEKGSNNGTLFTNGVGFPPNTALKSDLKLDWYRFGYRYTMPLFAADNGNPRLTLTPQINAVYWDFSFRTVGGSRRATRAYSSGNFQLGLGAEWRPWGGPFSLEAVGLIAPPIGSLPEIAMGQVAAKYRFIETPNLNVIGHVGVGVERIDFHDDQRFQSNHVRADFGPMILAGVELRF
jgi:hypothetical protein